MEQLDCCNYGLLHWLYVSVHLRRYCLLPALPQSLCRMYHFHQTGALASSNHLITFSQWAMISMNYRCIVSPLCIHSCTCVLTWWSLRCWVVQVQVLDVHTCVCTFIYYVCTYIWKTIACTNITHCRDPTACFFSTICTINAWCMLQSLEQLSTCMFATEAMCHCVEWLFPHCSLHDTQVYAVTEFPTVSGMEIGLSPPSDPVQFNFSGMNTHRRRNNTV